MILLGKQIGVGHRPLYVAELSQNYDGFEEAYQLMKACKLAGADAIKLQALDPDEITLPCFDLYELYKPNLDQLPELFSYGRDLDIPVFSSVFGFASLDRLIQLDCPAYKISSFENNWPELIKTCRSTGKPLLISTGMGGLPDLDGYVNSLNTIYLHCVSAYPCPIENANLNKLIYLRETVPHYGYSDHTIGTYSAEYATVLGAQVIEKHVSLREDTIDGDFSVSPYTFQGMVKACNIAWEAVYGGIRSSSSEQADEVGTVEDTMRTYKRSIHVVRPIASGSVIHPDSISVIRPSGGMEPTYFPAVLGKRATRDLQCGEPLTEDDVAW